MPHPINSMSPVLAPSLSIGLGGLPLQPDAGQFDPAGFRLGLPENLHRVLPEHLTAQVWGRAVYYAFRAHTEFAREPRTAVRYADKVSPYGTHPTWCAMQMMTEHALPPDLRATGALALLFHDLPEDTTAPLPVDFPADGIRIVQEMTFDSFADELARLWDRPIDTKLCKLYDKYHNLMEARFWAKPEKLAVYASLVERLIPDVVAVYGELNVVLQARGLISALKFSQP